MNATDSQQRPRVGLRALLVGGLLAALVVALLATQFASSDPDGLNRVAIDKGFAGQETDHHLAGSWFAGYESTFTDGPLSGPLAGVVGIAVTFLVMGGLALVVRRRRQSAS